MPAFRHLDTLAACLLGHGFSEAAQIRGWYRRYLLENAQGPKRKARLIKRALFWPLAAGRLAILNVASYGELHARSGNLSPKQQFLLQWIHAVRLGVSPEHFYLWDWHVPLNRRRASYFISNLALSRLLLAIARVEAPDEVATLGNKDRFSAWCREKGLPSAPIVAIFGGGRIIYPDGFCVDQLPAEDLFVKPTDSRCGQGTSIWRHCGERLYATGNDDPMDGCEMLSRLRHESTIPKRYLKASAADPDQQSLILLQRRLRNHHEIADYSPEALCTVRIVTMRRRDSVSVLAASFRMGRGQSLVDNASAGGIFAAVELSTGVLSAARGFAPDRCHFRHDRHPDTGARIQGRRIPCWPEILGLASNAHSLTRKLSFVGWDVAVTPEGPVLMEANLGWSADLLQMPLCQGLLETPFRAALLDRLRSTLKR